MINFIHQTVGLFHSQERKFHIGGSLHTKQWQKGHTSGVTGICLHCDYNADHNHNTDPNPDPDPVCIPANIGLGRSLVWPCVPVRFAVTAHTERKVQGAKVAWTFHSHVTSNKVTVHFTLQCHRSQRYHPTWNWLFWTTTELQWTSLFNTDNSTCCHCLHFCTCY